MQRSFWIGIAGVSLAVISWGIQLPVAKDAFIAVDAYHLTSVRFLGATICLSALLAIREGLGAFRYDGQLLSLTLIGIIGMCASPMLVFTGMSMSAAEHAVIIVSLQPSLTAIALWIIGKQAPRLFTVICIAVALLGVILVVTKGKPSFDGSKRALVGDVIVLGGAIAWVVYSLGAARFAGFSTWRLTVLTMIPGCLATLCVTGAMVYFGDLATPSLANYQSVGLEIIYLTLVGVVAAMLAWNFGLRRVGALNATLLINLMPVTAFTFRAWQGVRFAAVELIGVALVVGALVANNLMQRRLFLRDQRLNPNA